MPEFTKETEFKEFTDYISNLGREVFDQNKDYTVGWVNSAKIWETVYFSGYNNTFQYTCAGGKEHHTYKNHPTFYISETATGQCHMVQECTRGRKGGCSNVLKNKIPAHLLEFAKKHALVHQQEVKPLSSSRKGKAVRYHPYKRSEELAKKIEDIVQWALEDQDKEMQKLKDDNDQLKKQNSKYAEISKAWAGLRLLMVDGPASTV